MVFPSLSWIFKSWNCTINVELHDSWYRGVQWLEGTAVRTSSAEMFHHPYLDLGNVILLLHESWQVLPAPLTLCHTWYTSTPIVLDLTWLVCIPILELVVWQYIPTLSLNLHLFTLNETSVCSVIFLFISFCRSFYNVHLIFFSLRLIRLTYNSMKSDSLHWRFSLI